MRIAALSVVAFVSLGLMFFSVADEPIDKTFNIGTDINTLLAELQMSQQEIAAAKKELVDLEIFKKIALKQARRASTLDVAVQEELVKDPMLQRYVEQQYLIDTQIADLETTSKQSNLPQLKRLRQMRQAAKQDLQKYRVLKEQEIRQRLKSEPNALLAQRMTEYTLRKEAIWKKLAELENIPIMSEKVVQAMSDEQLRQTIAALCEGVQNLNRRVHDLEEFNKPRIIPCESK